MVLIGREFPESSHYEELGEEFCKYGVVLDYVILPF